MLQLLPPALILCGWLQNENVVVTLGPGGWTIKKLTVIDFGQARVTSALNTEKVAAGAANTCTVPNLGTVPKPN